ncbi:MAG: hypothetical protein ACXWCM_03185 [Acidimicrobiales bacterium]
MTQTEQDTSATRIIESMQQAEHSAFEAMRKFVDTVDSVFPDLSDTDEGPRRQIIDSAFKMVENLVGTSNKLAENVLQVSARAMEETSSRAAKK